MATDFEAAVLGRRVKIINASDGTVTANFYAIAPLEDIVFSSVTLAEGSTGADRLAGVGVAAGVPVVMEGTAIALTSGTAILYVDPF